MTDHARAIEAGARAKSFVTDEMVRTALNACGHADDVQYNVLWMRRALEAAIASGELVSASADRTTSKKEVVAAVAAERERCAALIDAECERILSKQTPEADPLSTNEAINSNLRMMAVLLPDLAAAIRALSSEPASGEFVVVPRGALKVLMDKTEYFDDAGPRDEGWQSDELVQARKDIDAAMLSAATKDGERK